jgi:hypothetical protein
MKRVTGLLLLTAALAAPALHAEEEGVGAKASRGIEKGASAAASGIEKGADATGRGVNKAVDATGRGFKKADDWLSNKLHMKSKGESKPVEPTKNPSP